MEIKVGFRLLKFTTFFQLGFCAVTARHLHLHFVIDKFVNDYVKGKIQNPICGLL